MGVNMRDCDKCRLKNRCNRNEEFFQYHSVFKYKYCKRTDCVENALRMSQMSDIERGYTLENSTYRKTEVFERVSTACKNFDWVDKGINIYLESSGPGTSKTYYACAILNEFIYSRAHFPSSGDSILALFVSMPSFITYSRKYSFNTEKQSEVDMVTNNITNAKLLVLDDMDTTTSTDHVNGVIYDIINNRIRKGLSTIYTSDRYADNLNIHDRIKSRLHNKTVFIKLDGADKRRGAF
jgi:DNA replication protein DnaC